MIGVILMVAITVVLAGVVYYMVGQMGEDPTSMRVGRIASWEKNSTDDAIFYFSPFKPDTRPMDLDIIFRVKGGEGPYLKFDETSSQYVTNPNHTIRYYDLKHDAYIQTGDYLVIDNLQWRTTYELIIIDTTNGDTIQEMEFVFQ